MRVLVADDEKGLVSILSEIISRKGHHVDVAYDGQKAFDLIRNHRYDLAFLDFTMPEMTGIELLQYLKEKNSGTRTVLITAYPFVEDYFAKATGMDEFLPKPIQLTDIEKILEKYKETG